MKIQDKEIASIGQDVYAKELIVKFESENIFKARIEQFGGRVNYIHADGKIYPVSTGVNKLLERHTSGLS